MFVDPDVPDNEKVLVCGGTPLDITELWYAREVLALTNETAIRRHSENEMAALKMLLRQTPIDVWRRSLFHVGETLQGFPLMRQRGRSVRTADACVDGTAAVHTVVNPDINNAGELKITGDLSTSNEGGLYDVVTGESHFVGKTVFPTATIAYNERAGHIMDPRDPVDVGAPGAYDFGERVLCNHMNKAEQERGHAVRTSDPRSNMSTGMIYGPASMAPVNGMAFESGVMTTHNLDGNHVGLPYPHGSWSMSCNTDLCAGSYRHVCRQTNCPTGWTLANPSGILMWPATVVEDHGDADLILTSGRNRSAIETSLPKTPDVYYGYSGVGFEESGARGDFDTVYASVPRPNAITSVLKTLGCFELAYSDSAASLPGINELTPGHMGLKAFEIGITGCAMTDQMAEKWSTGASTLMVPRVKDFIDHKWINCHGAMFAGDAGDGGTLIPLGPLTSPNPRPSDRIFGPTTFNGQQRINWPDTALRKDTSDKFYLEVTRVIAGVLGGSGLVHGSRDVEYDVSSSRPLEDDRLIGTQRPLKRMTNELRQHILERAGTSVNVDTNTEPFLKGLGVTDFDYVLERPRELVTVGSTASWAAEGWARVMFGAKGQFHGRDGGDSFFKNQALVDFMVANSSRLFMNKYLPWSQSIALNTWSVDSWGNVNNPPGWLDQPTTNSAVHLATHQGWSTPGEGDDFFLYDDSRSHLMPRGATTPLVPLTYTFQSPSVGNAFKHELEYQNPGMRRYLRLPGNVERPIPGAPTMYDSLTRRGFEVVFTGSRRYAVDKNERSTEADRTLSVIIEAGTPMMYDVITNPLVDQRILGGVEGGGIPHPSSFRDL